MCHLGTDRIWWWLQYPKENEWTPEIQPSWVNVTISSGPIPLKTWPQNKMAAFLVLFSSLCYSCPPPLSGECGCNTGYYFWDFVRAQIEDLTIKTNPNKNWGARCTFTLRLFNRSVSHALLLACFRMPCTNGLLAHWLKDCAHPTYYSVQHQVKGKNREEGQNEVEIYYSQKYFGKHTHINLY